MSPGDFNTPKCGVPRWSVHEEDLCSPHVLLLLNHHVLQGLCYGAGRTPAHHGGAAQEKGCWSLSTTQWR